MRNTSPMTAAVRGTLVVLFVCSSSCASDAKPNDVEEARSELRCAANVIEPDLDISPMGGSALDEQTGTYKLQAGQQVIVSSTYGVPRPGPEGAKLTPHYQEVMGKIIGQLQQQPGLLALQLGTSSSCNSGRTLAVWESEEMMYAFVTSAPHLEAINSVHELLQPGYAVTHWSANATDQMTLEAATGHLAEALER